MVRKREHVAQSDQKRAIVGHNQPIKEECYCGIWQSYRNEE